MTRIAIVGMACRYPDATSPRELWENAVAGRRAFRRLPDVRMRLADYYDPDPTAPDRFYARNAAVIEGYEFNRVAYKVAGSTYRSTDLTHWLALDVAAMALADAGFPMAEGLPRERTGVVVGNSLTGEFSRANQLRLRWPFVRRMVAAALKEQDWNDDQLGSFLDEFEATFKSPFPEIDEDTLAGGLSNTIAGRICNHFDLKGGGYTVDGACSSSLLSVATACKGLVDGELDVVVAGGVDLSIDPFEIIGFAKTGALATGEMKVYDKGSNGFWPGEGCGMVVLMREDDARKAGHRIYATVAGWGISSDGKGGITRPEVSGYQLALRRAYARAGFGIETVPLFEGHGTGTAVGDSTELRALTLARDTAGATGRPAAISSIKAMIGHTKAAAGVAGLIKAAMAVHHHVLPPAIGCPEPHDLLVEDGAQLRVLRKAEPFPEGSAIRAGITAMGFGGINTHIVLENDGHRRRRVGLDTRTKALASSLQDAELLTVDAASAAELRDRLVQLAEFVPTVAYAQLADVAVTLHKELRELPYRAAIVTSSPEDAERRLRGLIEKLDAGETTSFAADGRSFLGHAAGPGRIGYLFPGQGSGRTMGGGALRRRFAEADEVYARSGLPEAGDLVATEVAQPRIATGTLAGLRVLATLGLDATVAVGHSLGELSALHWAGAFDEKALLRIAKVRGAAMSQHSERGTMASVEAGAETVERLMADLPVVVAGFNGPKQTVIAGTHEAVDEVCARARDAGYAAARLRVSHAFHSPLVAPSAESFRTALADEAFGPVGRRVVSTITGEPLTADADLRTLLGRQITEPVQFTQAVAIAAKEVDLFVEVGPGRVLSGLAAAAVDVPAVALDTDDESLAGVLRVVAAAFVVNAAPVDAALFHGRLSRPLKIGAEFSFFASPCESAPQVSINSTGRTAPTAKAVTVETEQVEGESIVDLLRRMAAERAELPLELVREDSRLLDDLHLSSITVGQVVNQVAGQLGIAAAQTPTNFATATVKELADALAELEQTALSGDAIATPIVAGAAPWARPWALDLDELARPGRTPVEENGAWRVYSDAGSPLAEPLRHKLERAGVGHGVLVCLPVGCTTEQIELALHGAKAVLSGKLGNRFVLVQHDRGAAGLAKTLRLEAPDLRVTIVHVPAHGVSAEQAVEWIVDEVASTARFTEACYDSDGVRRVPTLRVLPYAATRTHQPLDESDVLLVTGGGKGITAECALALAGDSGAKLALLGRSDPVQDAELAANLDRMRSQGVTVEYARADVTDAGQVAEAVAELAKRLGSVTAVLHGAGRNEPASLTSVEMSHFESTFAPKIGGLRAVLDAVGAANLKLLVTLGSIIGRAGLRGEAHYATANEWLADLTLQVGRDNPGCRALCLEWSVWSGVGMGERLSVVESLARDGVTPITPEQGIAILRRLVGDPDAPCVAVISGRTQGIDTVRYDLPELPLLRFLDRPLVRYHGAELVSEAELSAGSDLYLADHLLDGNLLFPAVFGMEAMAQVAAAVTGRSETPAIEQAEFLRPIVVPPAGRTRIRVAAVVTGPGTVEVAIHSEDTGFAADHFRARLRYDAPPIPDGPPEQVTGLPVVPLDPANELYGPVLFQGDRFQRLLAYHRAAARHVDADVAVKPPADPGTPWFAGFLPSQLLLGDPGVRDALMHGNQVCVPDATLLPQGIERIWSAGPVMFEAGALRFAATERLRDGDTYVYDIALRTPDGTVIERWEGLRLRAVRKNDGSGPWAAPLLGPYLERSLGDLLGAEIAVTVEPDEAEEPPGDLIARRRARTALAASRSLGRPVKITYRTDGRPELAGGDRVSSAHKAGLTFCVSGSGPLGCDVDLASPRSEEDWQRLLGSLKMLADLVAQEPGETPDTAGVRVWAAIECLQKAGQPPRGPLTLQHAQRKGWVVFSYGELRIATFVTKLTGVTDPVVFAVLTEGRN
ncbi:MAG: SDR family NAD(P)-dependent oxidoreductase [Hamadaea sp.]|uniref:type I polyketide synthase n=1 Tax=Hamadaea sp. TaxID=2024425 RepID=UPI0018588996|nr:type I polyketide synthase [Hamadaea sp.]NUT18384.1 SDR family NAD(P)-dependent oxidoreductase [Hamadaea sp.]